MKPRAYVFLGLAMLCWLAAFLLTAREMTRFRAAQSVFPSGTVIAGVPVGGLPVDAARARLELVYTQTPVELRVEGAPVQVAPADLGQTLDAAGMLERAQAELRRRSDWEAFWDFLWNRPFQPVDIQRACSVDGAALRGWLERELTPRYTQAAAPAWILPGEAVFHPGSAGQQIVLEPALPQISAALCSATDRVVEIAITQQPAPQPTPEQLALALEAIVQTTGFDGVLEVYAQDIGSGAEISFAYAQQQPVPPGVAFTAASTIKIPVMVSAFRRHEGDLDESLRQRMREMIDLSDNTSTDTVMQTVLDPNIAPVQITEDARALGLDNTFLAGFFYPGAPLLDRYNTPANNRADVSTDPDIYNQTTAADMGRLLAAIYRCAADGSGLLTETFPNQITQAECGEMLAFLEANRKGVLIEAGLPEGTRMGHKYGWVTDPVDGLMHAASDAAVVTTSNGAFVLAIYLHDPEQLHWEPAVEFMARLATVLMNFYRVS